MCKKLLKMTFSMLLLILIIAEAANADTTVQTTNGPVRGKTVASGKVEAFLGIPYAEPPVGRLRFVKPAPKAKWEEVYNANQLPLSCTQANFYEPFTAELTERSEDCLYLNVWMPQSSDRSELKPIILWIHGGGWMFGSSTQRMYDGASLAERGDVIVASMNYRLGGLGFFAAFIEEAPGNIGMYDQVAAMRWIKQNAKVFQGDPDRIVLMGESAGAHSIGGHLLSPLSKNLFRRAILLSGSMVHPIFADNSKKLSKLSQKYADIIGCTPNGETLDKDAKSIVECMKNLPAGNFSEADNIFMSNLGQTPKDVYSQILYPRVGDEFLPENTIDMFRKGDFKDAEIFIGITRNEGSTLLAMFAPALFGVYGEKDIIPLFNENTTREFIRVSIGGDDGPEDEKIIQSYMDKVNVVDEYGYVKALRDAAGDYIISCGAVFLSDIVSLRNNSIYFYMFDYLSPSSPYAKWMGVPHTSDLDYVFGNFFIRKYTEKEKEFSRHLMDRLVAFAKTGDPDVPKSVTWPKYTFEDPKYIVFGQDEYSVEIKPDNGRCEVWRKKYRAIIDEDLIQALKYT